MHTVLNLDKNESVKVKEGQTIYDGFDENSLELPHGCLAGGCGACLIEVTSGAEFLNEASEVEKKTLNRFLENKPEYSDKHIRLSCRARVQDGKVEFKPI